MDLLLENLGNKNLSGVNYTIENPDTFKKFLKEEAEKIITEWNAKGGQAPITLKNLKEREWIELTTEIVQRNLEYDDLAIKRTEDGVSENTRVSEQPLDEILMKDHKGVCRQFAASVKTVGQVLKDLSQSPFLENVAVEELDSQMLTHGYNVVLEQRKKELGVYFMDITGDDETGFRIADKEAIGDEKTPYVSIAELFSKTNTENFMTPQQIITMYKNMLEVEKGNLDREQMWNTKIAEMEKTQGNKKEAQDYNLRALEKYKKIIETNRQKMQSNEKMIRSHNISKILHAILHNYNEKGSWDEMENILRDVDIWGDEARQEDSDEKKKKKEVRIMMAKDYIIEKFQNYDFKAMIEMGNSVEGHSDYTIKMSMLEAYLQQHKLKEGVAMLSRYYEQPETDVILKNVNYLLSIMERLNRFVAKKENASAAENMEQNDRNGLVLSMMENANKIVKIMGKRQTTRGTKNRDIYENLYKEAYKKKKAIWFELLKFSTALDDGNGESILALLNYSSHDIEDMLRKKHSQPQEFKTAVENAIQEKNIKNNALTKKINEMFQ